MSRIERKVKWRDTSFTLVGAGQLTISRWPCALVLAVVTSRGLEKKITQGYVILDAKKNNRKFHLK